MPRDTSGPSGDPLASEVPTIGARYQVLEGATFERLNGGLINDSYLARSPSGVFVLQALNPIFDPALHENIEAVTSRLQQVGQPTPRLLRTKDDALWAEDASGRPWRLLSFVEGQVLERIHTPQQAHSVGHLVGKFHAALRDLPHQFVGRRLGVHDTPKHLKLLSQALLEHASHRLTAALQPLAKEILARGAALKVAEQAGPLIGHGDLKLGNVIFSSDGRQARALIDLDTVGPIELQHELGDGWRSWCNSSAEDDASPRFDLNIFKASWAGYQAGRGTELPVEERRPLLDGVEQIALGLAARFAADSLNESYFGYDAGRFSTSGDHQLARARGQLALHQCIASCREERARILAVDPL